MKINIFKYFIVTVAAMSMVCSCDRHSIETPQEDTLSAIGFSNVSTKAELSDLQTNGFGVWASITNSQVENKVLMENQYVKYNDGKWEYSPLRYWLPKTEFNFIATYPYDQNEEYYKFDSVNSAVILTVNETPSEKDFLIATNMTDTSVEGFSETVDLQFKHLLTSVSLNIWRDQGKHQNDDMRIIKVTLGNIRKGGTYSSSANLWEPSNEKLTLEKVYEGGSANIGAVTVQEGGKLDPGGSKPADPFDDMMLIPQTLDVGSPVSLKIQYELKRQNAADWETAELETVLPSVTWQPNTCYTYNVVLSSVTDITVYYIQTKVDPWGTPQVGGTVIIK